MATRTTNQLLTPPRPSDIPLSETHRRNDEPIKDKTNSKPNTVYPASSKGKKAVVSPQCDQRLPEATPALREGGREGGIKWRPTLLPQPPSSLLEVCQQGGSPFLHNVHLVFQVSPVSHLSTLNLPGEVLYLCLKLGLLVLELG
ncbi:hypothetical protein E2C01_097598 [Portunus trituberculatus]|uniref:Uncharacterized protein n=1 Tax=Portunus trituberculatus TaxID=210409 RepID=A0A5B7JVL4_PORTR|nr:hypothetical protein [Portunus trituberculatus]